MVIRRFQGIAKKPKFANLIPLITGIENLLAKLSFL